MEAAHPPASGAPAPAQSPVTVPTTPRERAGSGSALFHGLTDATASTSSFDAGPWTLLAAKARRVLLRAGEWLFEAGDPGDSMFIVVAGQLEVVGDGPEHPVIRLMGRGTTVGELALITGTPRSAGVRARRDTELLRIGSDGFDELLAEQPSAAISIMRVLGAQLQSVRVPVVGLDPLPSVIAVVPLQPGLPVEGFGAELCGRLADHERVVGLDGPGADADGVDPAEYARLLDRTERRNDQVVLLAADPDPSHPWTAFCLRQADRILALTDATPHGVPPVHERLRGCDLVCVTAVGRPRRIERWMDALAPRATHLVAADHGAISGVDPIARRLVGRSIGVVLSGGGARGLAHLGVLEEFQRAGIVIDRVAGASAGSFIAAQVASGFSPEAIRRTCIEEFVRRKPMNDYTVPLVALTRSRKAEQMLRRVLGGRRIEELPIEFFCVSCDLVTADLVVHRRGPLVDAVGASMCLPGVFPPVARDGRLLVDGGVLNNLPVDVMATRSEGPVVAVDVSAHFDPPAGRGAAPPSRSGRLVSKVRELLIGGAGGDLPSFPETLIRSILLGSTDTAAAAAQYADVIITPDTGGVGLLDWHRIDELREAGRVAARQAVETVPCLREAGRGASCTTP